MAARKSNTPWGIQSRKSLQTIRGGSALEISRRLVKIMETHQPVGEMKKELIHGRYVYSIAVRFRGTKKRATV